MELLTLGPDTATENRVFSLHLPFWGFWLGSHAIILNSAVKICDLPAYDIETY